MSKLDMKLVYKFQEFLKKLNPYQIYELFNIELNIKCRIGTDWDNENFSHVILGNNKHLDIWSNGCEYYNKRAFGLKIITHKFPSFIRRYKIELSEELLEKWTFKFVI